MGDIRVVHAVDGIEYTFYVGCYDVTYRQDTIVPPYLPGLAIPKYQSILDLRLEPNTFRKFIGTRANLRE